MKKTIVFVTLFMCSFFTKGQDQLTNTGNFRTFPGAKITFYGNFSNNGILTDSAMVITFKGSSNQVISGSSVSNFKNLVTDNSSGVTLQQNVGITTSLSLISGLVNLNSKTLTIHNNSALSVSRNTGFILSENTNNASVMKWQIGSTTGSYLFPFGTSSAQYIPFVYKLTSGNVGNVSVATYPTAANNTPYPSAPNLVTNMNNWMGDNSANVVDRFWQIDKDGPDGTADLSFVATPSEVGPINYLHAQRWNSISGIWEAPLPNQTSSANSVTVYGVTNFSPWALSGNYSPLPIDLKNFSAIVNDKQVDIDWETLSENNSKYFTVEKSKDAINYENVSSVNGAGDSKSLRKYKITDPNPYKGISYYRLKLTDFDDEYEYFPIVAVQLTEEIENTLSVFPNPNNGTAIRLSLNAPKGEKMAIEITDLFGKICYSTTLVSTGEAPDYSVHPSQKLYPGIFTVTVRSAKKIHTDRLIIE